MIVEPTYKGYRIEVNAIPAGGRFNAEVRLLKLFTRDKHASKRSLFEAGHRACRARGIYLGAAVD